jgi:hypothetical protein
MRILEEYIYNNSDGFNVLNTIGNRKKKVVQTEIKMERLEKIDIVDKEQYQVVENIKQNLLRVQVVINDKKLDVKVSMNNKTKAEATVIIQEKIEKLIANEKLIIKRGKCVVDWE